MKDVATIRESDRILHIVTATDAVRDRLNKYAAWNDFSARKAAVGVAVEQNVEIADVRAFMHREGQDVFRTRFEEALRTFERRYSATSGLIAPKRPARKSAKARSISSIEFITNGP